MRQTETRCDLSTSYKPNCTAVAKQQTNRPPPPPPQTTTIIIVFPGVNVMSRFEVTRGKTRGGRRAAPPASRLLVHHQRDVALDQREGEETDVAGVLNRGSGLLEPGEGGGEGEGRERERRRERRREGGGERETS